MQAGTPRKRRRDDADGAVIAIMILALIAIVAGAGVYAWASGFEGGPRSAPTMSLAGAPAGCRTTLVVSALAAPVPLADLRIVPPAGASASMFALAGHASAGGWDGDGALGFLEKGSEIDVWAAGAEGDALLMHEPSNTVLARIRPAPSGPDTQAPGLAVTGTPGAPAGTASDAGCSGVVSVLVRVRDTTNGMEWVAPAELADAGGATTAWSADFSTAGLVAGRTYEVTATAYDGASNAGTAATMMTEP